MRRLLGGVLAAGAVLVSSGVHAIDVRNEDDRGYQVQVTSTAMTRDMEVRGTSLSIVICVGECDFYVPGVGRTKARGNDTVLIRNGRIVTQAAPRSVVTELR